MEVVVYHNLSKEDAHSDYQAHHELVRVHRYASNENIWTVLRTAVRLFGADGVDNPSDVPDEVARRYWLRGLRALEPGDVLMVGDRQHYYAIAEQDRFALLQEEPRVLAESAPEQLSVEAWDSVFENLFPGGVAERGDASPAQRTSSDPA